MTPKFSFPVMLAALGFAASSFSIAETINQSTTTATVNQAQSMQKSAEQSAKLNSTTTTTERWSEWGLTREDWARYQEVMQGARGVWSPGIDPLTALGVEARTDAERKRYAELLAKKEFQRTEKEFAFQIAYSKAFERLYPGILPFSGNDGSATPAAVGRILYFTRTDCGKRCADNLIRLWSAAGETPIDIYVVDSGQDDKKIQKWAMDNGIDIEKVKRRQITLNHDSGYWLHYANGKMPAAFTIQGDRQWKPFVY